MNNGHFYYEIWDSGFAPNVDRDILTLACCARNIRVKAKKDDWIFGLAGDPVISRVATSVKVDLLLSLYRRKINGFDMVIEELEEISKNISDLKETKESKVDKNGKKMEWLVDACTGHFLRTEFDVEVLYDGYKDKIIASSLTSGESELQEAISDYAGWRKWRKNKKGKKIQSESKRNWSKQYLLWLCRVDREPINWNTYYGQNSKIPDCSHERYRIIKKNKKGDKNEFTEKCNEKCMGDCIYYEGKSLKQGWKKVDREWLMKKYQKQTWYQKENINHNFGNARSDIAGKIIISNDYRFFGDRPLPLEKITKNFNFEKFSGVDKKNKINPIPVTLNDCRLEIIKKIKTESNAENWLMGPCKEEMSLCCKVRCMTHGYFESKGFRCPAHKSKPVSCCGNAKARKFPYRRKDRK